MAELSKYEAKALEAFEKSIRNGKWSRDGLVSTLKLSFEYLNGQRVSNYARDNGISPQGAAKFRDNVKLDGVKFNIDFH